MTRYAGRCRMNRWPCACAPPCNLPESPSIRAKHASIRTWHDNSAPHPASGSAGIKADSGAAGRKWETSMENEQHRREAEKNPSVQRDQAPGGSALTREPGDAAPGTTYSPSLLD